MTTGPLWIDAPTVSALLLVRDAVGTVSSFSSPVFLVATHSSLSPPSTASCLPSSGFCIASIALPPTWFPGNVTLSYGLTTTTTTPLLSGPSAVVLNPNASYSINNNVVIALPQRNLRAGDSFTVNVQANAANKVSLFTLSFTVDPGLSITSIGYVTSDWQAVVKKNSNTVRRARCSCA